MQYVPGECRISGELLREVLASPVLERWTYWRESSKGLPSDGGFGASVLGGKVVRAGVVWAAHVSPVLVRQVQT